MPPSPPHRRSPNGWLLLWQSVQGGVYGVGGMAAIATYLGFLNQGWWGFHILDQLRIQYLWPLGLAILLGVLSRQRWSWIWIAPFVTNLVILGLLFIPPVPANTPVSDTTLRLLHGNVDRGNSNPAQMIQYLDAQTVDVMLIQEVTPEWFARLQSDLQHYTVVAAEPRSNSHGSALLLPVNPVHALTVQSTQIIYLPETSDRPLLEATLSYGDRRLKLLSLHVTRPRNSSTTASQYREFQAVAEWSQQQLQQGQDVLIMGDFNSTPWSSQFRAFVEQAQLINSQRGFGLQPTWPAGFPPLLQIPIDHCLHSPSWITVHREIGPALGSDHLPLTVELALR